MDKTETRPIYIEEKLDKILELLSEVHKAMLDPDAPITVDEIAEYWGVGKRSLYGAKRYLLPNFGKSEDGVRNSYKKGEFYKWAAIGREELRRRYKEHGIAL